MRDAFDDEVASVQFPRRPECHCGGGYCQRHGTFHYSAEVESDEVERRTPVAWSGARGCRGGRRVIVKKAKY